MATVPDGAKKPSDRLKAEAKAEEGYVVEEFKGVALRVRAFLDWDMDAMSHLNVMNFLAWAPCALHPDDVAKFSKVKATQGEALKFIKAVAAKGGADLGEYLAS
jgi:hypothetical protein